MSTIFDRWAIRGHFTDWMRKPERRMELVHEVKRICDVLDLDARLNTTQLIGLIGVSNADKKTYHYVRLGLSWIRKHKIIEGYWMPGPKTNFTFGKPSVIWVNPKSATAGLEGVL